MMTLEKFEEASEIVKKATQETKLIYSKYFSEQTGNKVYLKPENMQTTGAYKVRGAYYKISQLSEEESAKGVIACSAGNHAQGVALAATRGGIRRIGCCPPPRLYAGRRTPDEGGEHQKSGRGGLPCARHLRRSPRQGRAAAKGVRHDLYPPLR